MTFSNNQFTRAHRAFDLGVGSKPICRRNLIAQRLSDAIKFALSDNIISNAKSLAQKIASEKGAMECAKIIVKRLEV